MALGISQKVARLLLARPTHSVGGGLDRLVITVAGVCRRRL